MALLGLLAQSVLALLGAAAVAVPLLGEWQRRRQQDQLLDRSFPGEAPPASVVVPVKGRHQELAANVGAFLDQDHPDLEVLFVVDEMADPAAPVIEKVLDAHGDADARLLSVAEHGNGDGYRIGKARAQATGVRHLRDASEVVVFADADARPRQDWARRMTVPLAGDPGEPDPDADYEDRPVGAVTTYRWYVSKRHGFWSRVRAQWNGTGHDALVDPETRFCWGGSMATRRALFDSLDVAEAMSDRLADDVALTDAVEEAGYRIVYEPRAACVNVEDCSEEECHEWCIRQTAITRATMPDLWKRSYAMYAVGVGSFVLGTLLVGLSPLLGPVVGLSGAGLMVPVLSEPLRTRRRWRFFHELLDDHRDLVQAEPDLPFLALMQPFYMLWVIRRSQTLDAIEWRGRTYPIEPADDVRNRHA